MFLKNSKLFWKHVFSNTIFFVFTSSSYKGRKKITELGSLNIKDGISGLRQFLATENPLKMMKNAFCFTLRALSVLKIIKDALSGLRQFLATFKNDEKCFLFHLNSSLREAIKFLKFLLLFLRTNHVNQKWKRGFPMMVRFVFSEQCKVIQAVFEKKNQAKKSLRKAK